MNLEVFVSLAMLMVVVLKLIEAIIQPLFVKLKLDTWWLLYVSLVLGFGVGWATGLNAFPVFGVGYEVVGRILTSLACGAGPTFLYDMIDNGQAVRLPRKL